MSGKNDIMQVIDWPVFSLDQRQKQNLLLSEINRLTNHHQENCIPYQTLLQKFHGFGQSTNGPDTNRSHINRLKDVPYIPVRLFKHQDLKSVPESEIIKTMTSSGTSGQTPSRIYLDKTTAGLQVKILAKIMQEFIGPKRLPMLIIDSKETVSNRLNFSARAAGILGFSMFGRKIEYALDEDLTPNIERIEAFMNTYGQEDFLLFGFTFIIWQYLLKTLETKNRTLSMDKGILIHGGGWKKLLNEKVDNNEYKKRLHQSLGLKKVFNYYGMVEQTGSIFMECEEGHLHAPAWSDILIRDPKTLEPVPVGKSGLVQLLSVIPHSYPGHSILSEDIGTVLGIDNCPCGRKGTYFQIEGRLKQAEVRGCSDTHS